MTQRKYFWRIYAIGILGLMASLEICFYLAYDLAGSDSIGFDIVFLHDSFDEWRRYVFVVTFLAIWFFDKKTVYSTEKLLEISIKNLENSRRKLALTQISFEAIMRDSTLREYFFKWHKERETTRNNILKDKEYSKGKLEIENKLNMDLVEKECDELLADFLKDCEDLGFGDNEVKGLVGL